MSYLHKPLEFIILHCCYRSSFLCYPLFFAFNSKIDRGLLSISKSFSVYPARLNLVSCVLKLSLSVSEYPAGFSLCYTSAPSSPMRPRVHNNYHHIQKPYFLYSSQGIMIVTLSCLHFLYSF